jgi:hypothetical protein
MISKQFVGKSFKGVVNYLFSKVEIGQGEVLECRGVRWNKNEMISDFNESRKANPKLTKCVLHCSLSFQARDNLSNDRMVEIAVEWLEKMGMSNTAYAILKHNDTPTHPHVHIILTRIDDNGLTISDKHNFKRGKQECQKLIKTHSLSEIPEFQNLSNDRSRLRGKELFKWDVYVAVHQLLPKCESLDNLASMLWNKKKINMIVKLNMTDQSVRGIIFQGDGGISIKASKVNKYYTAHYLQEYFKRKESRKFQLSATVTKSNLAQAVDNFSEANKDQDDLGVIKLENFLSKKLTLKL